MGFEVRPCRAYHPQTKGKVETLAKLTDRILPYNNEFETLEELINIAKQVIIDINNNIS